MSDIGPNQSPSSALMSLLDEDDDIEDGLNSVDDYDADMLLGYSDEENIEPFPTTPPHTQELVDYESDVELEPTKSSKDEEQSSEYNGEKDESQEGSSGYDGGASFSDHGGRPLPSFSTLPGIRSPRSFGSHSSFGSLDKSVSVPSSETASFSTVTASASSSSSNLMDVDETDAGSAVMRSVVPKEFMEGIRIIKREDLESKATDGVKKENDVQVIGSFDNKTIGDEVQIIGFKQGHKQNYQNVPVVSSFDGKAFSITGKANSRRLKEFGGRPIFAKSCGMAFNAAIPPPNFQTGTSGFFPRVKRGKHVRCSPPSSGHVKRVRFSTTVSGSQAGLGHGGFSISGRGRGGFSPPGPGGFFSAGRGSVPLASRGGVPFAGRGSVPLASRGGVPFAGRGGVPLASRGGVPLASRGGVPLASRGGVRPAVRPSGRVGVPPTRRGGFVAAASRSFQVASNFLNRYINKGPELASLIVNCPKFHEEKAKRIKTALGVREPIDVVVQRSDGSGLVYVTKTVPKDSALTEIGIINAKKFDGEYLKATLFKNLEPENFPAVVLNL